MFLFSVVVVIDPTATTKRTHRHHQFQDMTLVSLELVQSREERNKVEKNERDFF